MELLSDWIEIGMQYKLQIDLIIYINFGWWARHLTFELNLIYLCIVYINLNSKLSVFTFYNS